MGLKKISVFLICMAISGCASQQVGYVRAKSPDTEGYSDTKIQEGVYSIQFKGRSDTNVQRISDFALLRAAELALRDGYSYFTVLTEKSDDKKVTDAIPHDAPTIACSGRHCFSSFYTVWQTYSYSIPSIYFMVQAHKEKPDTHATVFDARQVKSNIETQYGLVQAPVPPRTQQAARL
jgi:hypothetical protein